GRAEDDSEHFRAADIDTDRRAERHSSPAQRWPPKRCRATAVAAATLSESTPPAIAIRADRHKLSTDALRPAPSAPTTSATREPWSSAETISILSAWDEGVSATGTKPQFLTSSSAAGHGERRAKGTRNTW